MRGQPWRLLEELRLRNNGGGGATPQNQQQDPVKKQELGMQGAEPEKPKILPKEEDVRATEQELPRRRYSAWREADDYMHDRHMKDLRLYD
jgi:hypothetical protein